MWQSEVKSRSKLEVELSKITKEAEDERVKVELLSDDLTKATREKKAFKTKYEQLKREKMDTDRRAESYRFVIPYYLHFLPSRVSLII